MKHTRGSLFLRLGPLAVLALAACGGSEAAESGGFEITDSAGIKLVRNPAELADSS